MSNKEKNWLDFIIPLVVANVLMWAMLFIFPAITSWSINPANWNIWLRGIYGALCCVSSLLVFVNAWREFDDER